MKGNQPGLNVHTQGAGPLFIWGHGLLGSMQGEDAFGLFNWASLPKRIKLLRYDARGHGSSETGSGPCAYTWPALGRDMCGLARQYADGQAFVLGGQSMGCATALFAALESPGQVSALVLVNPPTAWQTRAAQRSYYRKGALVSGLLGGALLAKSMRNRLARLWPFWLLSAKPEQALASLENMRLMKRCTLFNILRGAASSDLPDEDALSGLSMPVLILAWSDDQSHPLQTAETLARTLPGAQLCIARNSEDVGRWPQLISDFVSQNAGKSTQ